MNYNIEQLQLSLCSQLCSEIKLAKKNESLLRIDTPFFFPDGDPYQIFIKEMPGGIMRLTDMGHTLMHLSYDNDIDKFRHGTRENLFSQLLADTQINESDGELFHDTSSDKLAVSIFQLGQAISKLNDLTFLNRARAESTFYEDLKESLYNFVPDDKIHQDYFFPDMPKAEDYPIDYMIDGINFPLLLFGIPNRDKARLVTIVLEHLLHRTKNFESLLIFADQSTIPRLDLARLSNVGGEMIASLDAKDDFSRKLLKRVSPN